MKKDFRIFKTLLIILSMSSIALITPIFGQFYHQKTGIDPLAFYMITSTGGIILGIITILKIWGEIK